MYEWRKDKNREKIKDNDMYKWDYRIQNPRWLNFTSEMGCSWDHDLPELDKFIKFEL